MTSYSKFVPYVMKELQVCLRDNGSCYMDIEFSEFRPTHSPAVFPLVRKKGNECSRFNALARRHQQPSFTNKSLARHR